MPIYLYQCCGQEVEVIRAIDADTPICPQCGAKMTKSFTNPALIVMKNRVGTASRSKGYKEGYGQEYLKSIGKA